MRSLLLILALLPAACAPTQQTLSNKPPSLRVGAAALADGVPDAALAIARRQLAQNRDDIAALLIEGQALTQQGNMPGAEASFRRAVTLTGNGAGAEFGLGRVLLLTGRAAEAEQAFHAVLVRKPDDPIALTDLGIARDMQDHHADAQTAYYAALAAAPDLDAARVNLGLSLALGGAAAQAVDVLGPLANRPNAPRRVRHDLAAALAMDGDLRGAEALLRTDLAPGQLPVALAAFAQLHAN